MESSWLAALAHDDGCREQCSVESMEFGGTWCLSIFATDLDFWDGASTVTFVDGQQLLSLLVSAREIRSSFTGASGWQVGPISLVIWILTGISFWSACFLFWYTFQRILSFFTLFAHDRSLPGQILSWHGWLLGVYGSTFGSHGLSWFVRLLLIAWKRCLVGILWLLALRGLLVRNGMRRLFLCVCCWCWCLHSWSEVTDIVDAEGEACKVVLSIPGHLSRCPMRSISWSSSPSVPGVLKVVITHRSFALGMLSTTLKMVTACLFIAVQV